MFLLHKQPHTFTEWGEEMQQSVMKAS